MKKNLLLSILVVATAGSATACSSNSQSSSTDEQGDAKTTIVFASTTINGTGLREKLIEEFEKQHPEIEVQIQDTPTSSDSTRNTLTVQISGGSATPDVYLGDVTWPGQFAKAGLAKPLNDVFPAEFWNRYSEQLVQSMEYKGNKYATPLWVGAPFLYYRKDLLEQANLPVPTTWEQLVQVAAQLQKSGAVKYGFVYQGTAGEGTTANFMEYLFDAGGTILDESGKPALNTPAAKKALSFMKDIVSSGVAPAAQSTMAEQEALSVFNNGEAAFMRNWNGFYARTQVEGSKVVNKVGIAPLPTFTGGDAPGTSTIGGWSLYINPQSKHLEADKTFIEWMTGHDAQTILAENNMLPAVQSVREDQSQIAKSPVLTQYQHVKLQGRPSQSPDYGKLSNVIYTNVNAVLAGSKSIDQALNDAQAGVDQVVNRTGL
jgi:multiple sugar transport system substrate-binding protein